MDPNLDAFLRSWPFDPWLDLALLLTAALYLRGWRICRQRDPRRWHGGQPAAFLAGLAAIFLALASPLEPFSFLLLQVHMAQHLLLMMAAPPLLWLGAPFFPLLRGLPRPVRIVWVAPLVRWRPVRRTFEGLTHPVPAWVLYVTATWLWHSPGVYDLALRADGWHYLQHACFLATALLFWYPVVRPYPSRPAWPAWLLAPYLILADVQNTALSALLTFSDRVLYPHYEQMPRLAGVTALDDQAVAGVLMWVPGSLAFLVPLFVIGTRLLLGRGEKVASGQWPVAGVKSASQRLSLPLVASTDHWPLTTSHSPPSEVRFDLLRMRILGKFLRWRHARLAMQIPLLLLAGLVIYDGLCGPQVGPMNLAGVLPWIHWRGLVVLGLLAAGNFFCMGCPFLAPRTLARRWLPEGRPWPRWLRNKWPAVALLLLFFWAYEAFALWDCPWWTAGIGLGFFAGAFAVDTVFRGASFCKYVCPIGQFNFVQSLCAALEVKVRDPAVCAVCTTKDCIRGRPSPSRGAGELPGCELRLFLPRKAGNMDCTFCLDCVHACPHDNIGITAGLPGADLWRDRSRSGIGRFTQRPDLAALVLVLVFAAFVNAGMMVAPVVAWQESLELPRLLTTTLFCVAGLLIVPALLTGAAATLSRRWGGLATSQLKLAMRYAYALVPLGFGMWLAHYSFHFLTSWETAGPTAQRFAADHGWSFLGLPDWVASCCRPVTDGVLRLEIIFLDLGFLLSLYTGYRLALADAPRLSGAWKVLAPWALVLLLLFALGLWIVFQPMEMRGTMPG